MSRAKIYTQCRIATYILGYRNTNIAFSVTNYAEPSASSLFLTYSRIKFIPDNIHSYSLYRLCSLKKFDDAGQLLRGSNQIPLAEKYYHTAYKMRAYYHDADSTEMIAFLKELFNFFMSLSKFSEAKFVAVQLDSAADVQLLSQSDPQGGIPLKYDAALRLSSVEHHLGDYATAKRHLKKMIALLKANKTPSNQMDYKVKIHTLRYEISELKKSKHAWWKVWKR